MEIRIYTYQGSQLIDISAVQTRERFRQKRTPSEISKTRRDRYSVFTHLVINGSEMKINVCPLL